MLSTARQHAGIAAISTAAAGLQQALRHFVDCQGRRDMSWQAASGLGLLAPRNIWCVGRNYAEHAKELGNPATDVGSDPMIFLKAGSSLLHSGQPLVLPSWSQQVNHEIEMAIELGDDLQPCRVAVALDLTARDVQACLKAKQWPWTLAKSFPHSAPLGSASAVSYLNFSALHLHLTVNGKTRQSGNTSDMLFTVPVLLEYVKSHFPVVAGDLLLTGTPVGVSVIHPGDALRAELREGGSDGRLLSEGEWRVVRQ